MREGHQAMRGCHGPAEASMSFAFAPELRRCPWATLYEAEDASGIDLWGAIAVWRSHKSIGLLPWPGGLHEQPAWVAELLEACEAAVLAEQRRRGDDERRQATAALEQARDAGRMGRRWRDR